MTETAEDNLSEQSRRSRTRSKSLEKIEKKAKKNDKIDTTSKSLNTHATRSKSHEDVKGVDSPKLAVSTGVSPKSHRGKRKSSVVKSPKGSIPVSDNNDKVEVNMLDNETNASVETGQIQDGEQRSVKKKRKSRSRTNDPKANEEMEIQEGTEESRVLPDKQNTLHVLTKTDLKRTSVATVDDKTEKTEDSITSLLECPFVSKTPLSVIVAVSHPSTYTIKGCAGMRVLVGAVTILGCTFTQKTSWHDVYSPGCSSLLTMSTTNGDNDVDEALRQINENCPSFMESERLCSSLKTAESFCIIEFQKLFSSSCNLVTSFSIFSNLLKPFEDSSQLNKKLSPLGISLVKQCDHSTVQVSSELQTTLDEVSADIVGGNTEVPVVMLCGGKDSGKSTTCRLLINTLLNSLGSVYFLECDVGQAEFTPAGVVSLLEISQPVFGQPFCHQRKPLCAFLYGGLSPRESPNKYLMALRSCVEKFKSLNNCLPLVVNTMGWIKDLGYQVLVDTARLVHPTHILQLSSHQWTANIPPLEEQFHLHTSWTDLADTKLDGFSPGPVRQTPIIYQIPPAPVNGIPAIRLKPADHRTVNLLSHLGNHLEKGLTLVAKEPFYVPWREVAVHVSFARVPRSQVMYALNASVVGLCAADITQAETVSNDGPRMFDRLPQCKWLGYGIVRSVDHMEKLLYVTTSLPLDEMASVNTLVKTLVSIPDELLLSQRGDDLPYVNEKVQSAAAGSVKPRRFMPRRSGLNSEQKKGSSLAT